MDGGGEARGVGRAGCLHLNVLPLQGKGEGGGWQGLQARLGG